MVIFGIRAALNDVITAVDGRIEQANFDSYRILRMNPAPQIETHMVDDAEPTGCMGETGTSAIVPAIVNSVFAATGQRLRRMPVDPASLKCSAQLSQQETNHAC